jgi:hypothetical protein
LELRSAANLETSMVALMGGHLVEMSATKLGVPRALPMVDQSGALSVFLMGLI